MGMKSTVSYTRTTNGITRTYALHAGLASRDPEELGVLFDLRAYAGFRLRMRWAEAGFAVERIVGGAALPLAEEVHLDFLAEALVRDPHHVLARLVAPIPAEALSYVARLPARQLHALRVCTGCPSAVDLVRSSPRLLWIVLAVTQDRATTMDELREVLARRRHEILGWCGGVPTRAAVRYVERRVVKDLGDEQLRKVLAECSSPAVIQDTLHVRAPDDWSAMLTREHPEVLRSEAGRQAIDPETRTHRPWELWNLWRDALRMAEDGTAAEIERRLTACGTAERMQQVHDEVMATFLERQPEPRGHIRTRLPAPPLAGSAEIQPLATSAAIELEGRLMHHCCGVYVHEVRARHSYLYRVLAPERATLELDLRHARPRIAQIKLARNGKPSAETQRAAEAWLAHGLDEAHQNQERAAARRARRKARDQVIAVAAE